ANVTPFRYHTESRPLAVLRQTMSDCPSALKSRPMLRTVRVAAAVATDPALLVKTARNCLLKSAAVAVNAYAAAVAAGMSVHVAPSVLNCHFTDDEPVAAAANCAVLPAGTVRLAGFDVT